MRRSAQQSTSSSVPQLIRKNVQPLTKLSPTNNVQQSMKNSVLPLTSQCVLEEDMEAVVGVMEANVEVMEVVAESHGEVVTKGGREALYFLTYLAVEILTAAHLAGQGARGRTMANTMEEVTLVEVILVVAEEATVSQFPSRLARTFQRRNAVQSPKRYPSNHADRCQSSNVSQFPVSNAEMYPESNVRMFQDSNAKMSHAKSVLMYPDSNAEM